MNSSEIVSQALEHLSALLLIWLTIYVVYWFLGIAKWPHFARRDQWLDRWGRIDPQGPGGFSLSSLALISLCSLFLELLLIRWIAAEIRIFSYFKSLVLTACFLGFGLGCYLTRKPVRLAFMLSPLLAMVFFIELPWDPIRRLVTQLSAFIGWFSDVHIWSRAYFRGNPIWGVAAAGVAMSVVIPLFGLIAITFIPMGQLVGGYLENSKKGVLAYSVNVFASIVGIWLYTGLCFLSTPPVVWFAALGVGLLIYFWKLVDARRSILLSFAVMIGLFFLGLFNTRWWGEESWKGARRSEYELEAKNAKTYWSPYQKLTVVPLKRGGEIIRYVLQTNDSWYQQILNLSDSAITKDPALLEGVPIKFHQYNLPYRFFQQKPDNVLIAGAGMGNDPSAALRNGAGHVDAVEIDPLIYRKGKELHFEHPYSSDRVTIHVDDARAFVMNTKDKYDLIVFSILDSHTTSSYYTNIRIDNYVYTLEAMQQVRKLLKPDGLFVMSYSSERPWFTQRLKDVVTLAFGKPPLMVQPDVSFFVIGPGDRVERTLASDPELRQFVDSHSNFKLEPAEPVTDDWPYLYQQNRGIPVIVWVLSLGLIVVVWAAFRNLKQSAEGVQWHFFFLGAAFMLLEVQVISKTALLFGTTWLVNSIVITTLLLFILLSNLVVARFSQVPKAVAYGGLFITLVLGYLIPTNALFYDSMLVRGAVAMALFCSPVFFAGLVFISSFRRIGFRAEAFGSNLLGALVGGLLDSLSFAIGINALLIIAFVLYFLSLLTIERVPGRAQAPAMAAAPSSA